LTSRASLFDAFEHAAHGRSEEVKKILQTVLQNRDEVVVPAEYLAAISAVADNKDDAFFWLERALEERSEQMLYLNVDPIYDNLRRDPQFVALLKRVRKRQQQGAALQSMPGSLFFFDRWRIPLVQGRRFDAEPNRPIS
jgi:hypothetical protein